MGSLLAEFGVNVPQRFKRLIGVVLMAVVGFCFVLAGGLTQLAMQIADGDKSTFTILQVTVRSVVALVRRVFFMIVRGTHPYGMENGAQLFYLILCWLFSRKYISTSNIQRPPSFL